MGNIPDKVCTENQNTHFMFSNTPLPPPAFPSACLGYRAERARGSDGPDHKGLSDTVGGTIELGCNSPRRRTIQNQTNGRRRSGSCGESKLYKGVNPD